MVYALSRLSKSGNQKTTQYSNYITEIMSEINDNKELPGGIFPIKLKQNRPISPEILQVNG